MWLNQQDLKEWIRILIYDKINNTIGDYKKEVAQLSSRDEELSKSIKTAPDIAVSIQGGWKASTLIVQLGEKIMTTPLSTMYGHYDLEVHNIQKDGDAYVITIKPISKKPNPLRMYFKVKDDRVYPYFEGMNKNE